MRYKFPQHVRSSVFAERFGCHLEELEECYRFRFQPVVLDLGERKKKTDILFKRFDGACVSPMTFIDILTMRNLLYEVEYGIIDLACLPKNVRHALGHKDVFRDPVP